MKNDGEILIPFTWAGMICEVLVRKTNGKFFGIYVGYIRENVRPGFSMRLKGTFTLVDTDEREPYPIPPKGL